MKTNKTRETYIEHYEKKAYSAPSIHEIGLIAEKTKANAALNLYQDGQTDYDGNPLYES
jgi:hypothetical protein